MALLFHKASELDPITRVSVSFDCGHLYYVGEDEGGTWWKESELVVRVDYRQDPDVSHKMVLT